MPKAEPAVTQAVASLSWRGLARRCRVGSDQAVPWWLDGWDDGGQSTGCSCWWNVYIEAASRAPASRAKIEGSLNFLVEDANAMFSKQDANVAP